MCGRFTGISWDELLEVARIVEYCSVPNAMPDWPAVETGEGRDFFPGAAVPLLVADARERAARATWLTWSVWRA